ncbi:MFS transporter [Pseudonocardia sp. TRM90224]|uniref:MFS transporter n=1 Tax=Pseudonocardia sp. TRM90224 TaxID=2812678 RepID=UPI001E5DF4C0|nr:MFS transporter [Pseudonocardia sp. TRM90224]
MTEQSLAAPSAARSGTRATTALLVLASCQLMVVLDATVVNVALPAIQTELGFSPTGLSWVLNAYAITLGGLLLLGGRAGDLFGRRRMFTAGIAVFTVASLLGGFALDPFTLLAARVLQGVGAAAAGPNALALLMVTFSEPRARARALSVWAAVSSVGGSIGLILGGLLTESISWRWVLFINVPIGIVLLLMIRHAIPVTEGARGRVDVAGALTSTAGMTALVYAFVRVGSDGWADPVAIGAFVVAALALTLLVLIERRVAEPVLPLSLLADRARATGFVSLALAVSAMFGTFFFLTQYLQVVMGFAPLLTGAAFLPLTLGILVMSRLLPRIVARWGTGIPPIVGATFVLIGSLLLSTLDAGSSYAAHLLAPMILLGVGAASMIMPLTMIILGSVPRTESGAASGLMQTVQQTGGAIGVSVLVTVFGLVSSNRPDAPLAAQLTSGVGAVFLTTAAFAAAVLALRVAALVRPNTR